MSEKTPLFKRSGAFPTLRSENPWLPLKRVRSIIKDLYLESFSHYKELLLLFHVVKQINTIIFKILQSCLHLKFSQVLSGQEGQQQNSTTEPK